VTLHASDQTVHLVEAVINDDGVYVLDPGGDPLQYIAPPFVVRFPEPAPFAVNRIIAAIARRRLGSRARQAGIDLTTIRFDAANDSLRRPPFTFRPLPLVHPRARALAREHPKLTLGQHSVFVIDRHLAASEVESIAAACRFSGEATGSSQWAICEPAAR